MKLQPKIIPLIARETVQQLMQDGDIEVEPMRIADAEMDLSAIMREYLTNEERLNQATREALERRGLDNGQFSRVKRELAGIRGFKLDDDGIELVVDQMIEFLLLSRNVEEVFAGDAVLREKTFAVVKKHLDVDHERLPSAPSAGGSAPPPSFRGEASGGMPAEGRVSDTPPRPAPPREDPDRRESDASDGSDVG